jgi:hypothetical protein
MSPTGDNPQSVLIVDARPIHYTDHRHNGRQNILEMKI